MKHFCSILFLLLLFSCNSKKDFSLNADWFVVQQSYDYSDSSGYQSMALQINTNGSYTHFGVNFYNTGTWKWNELTKQITLLPLEGNPQNGKFIFEVVGQKKDELQVKRIIKKENVWVKYKSIDKWYRSINASASNPFDDKYNQWRIKPTKLETKEEVRIRTLQYVEFLKICFTYQVENKIESLTHGWYPQPFKLHFINTARMAYNTELTDWYKCFFNEEQGIEAYKIISKTMSKIKLRNKETLAERNLDLITQLLKEIE